jgi:hypothetical protein
MAYAKPIDLDGFIPLMSKPDMRIKTQLAEDLVNYLSDYDNTLLCTDLGLLIDALIPWLTGSHFKVSFFSVSIIIYFAEKQQQQQRGSCLCR